MESRKFRTHTKWNGKELIPKKSFDNEKDAINAARYMNTQEHIIHKMVAYKCITCGKFHIGSTSKILTSEDKIKNLKKYNQIKTFKLL